MKKKVERGEKMEYKEQGARKREDTKKAKQRRLES